LVQKVKRKKKERKNIAFISKISMKVSHAMERVEIIFYLQEIIFYLQGRV
jgi:hypothetical protein